MKIGDSVFVHGYVDEIRKDCVIIRNRGGYFGTDRCEIIQGDIVRCKDCKWSDWYETLNGEHRCYCMEHGSSGHTEDDYCSYGEREESKVEE